MFIKKGSRGSLVRNIQEKLSIGIDGKFGSITEEAVILFQNMNTLPATGIVDDTTWLKMFGSLPSGTNSVPPKTGGTIIISPSDTPFNPEQCICQNGLSNEAFIRCFYPERVGRKDKFGNPLPEPKLFSHVNMKDFPAVRNTPLSVFLQELNACFTRYEISNCKRKAHFLAQIWWESDHFNTLQEYASGEAYNPGKRVDAKVNGNTEPGDGPRYKGRGGMQLTWKNTYKRYQQFLDQNNPGTTYDVVNDPYSISGNLFLAFDSAGWFWTHGKLLNNGNVINLNKLADEINTDRISILVNGGGNGKKERRLITQKLLNLFNASKCIHQ